jgi:hypothetical protein
MRPVPSVVEPRRPRLFAVLAALAVSAIAAVVALDRSREAPPAPAAAHEVAIPADARTVMVSRTMPMPSAHERRLSAMVEEGELPARPMAADVLTDSDCTPDAEGVSRCRNVVLLEDGRRLVLRHPHDMRTVPCLAPGERVRLVPNSV